jgi:membrane protein
MPRGIDTAKHRVGPTASQDSAEAAGEPELRARARAGAAALLDGFKRHDLLTYASAISYQVLTAVVPFLLFVLAVAALLHAHGLWRQHLAPQIRSNVPAPIFAVIENAVTTVFARQAVLWATLGGLLALWQVSGAVRAVMGALAGIYEAPSQRPFLKHYARSFLLSIEVSVCFVLVAGCLLFAPFFWSAHDGLVAAVFAFIVRWGLVVALLLLIVARLVRHGPARYQPWHWVTMGATLVTGSWLVASLLFYLYLTDVASYETVFGSLADGIVGMAYLYVSTTAFLFGAQLDAIIRREATGCPSGFGDRP